jgi:hypothetical protein
MSTPHDPNSDSNLDPNGEPQKDPQASGASGRSPARRRWAVPLAFVGGAAAVALVGGLALAGAQKGEPTAMAMVRAERQIHAVNADAGHRGPDQAMQMQRRSAMDPALRDEHLSELAALAGMDVDELSATLEAFRSEQSSEREAMRDELADLDPDERRERMLETRGSMRAALAEELGIDPAELAELHAGAEHGERFERMEERMQQRAEGRAEGRMGGRMGLNRHA